MKPPKRQRRKLPARLRLAVFLRDGWQCVYCERPTSYQAAATMPTVDHLELFSDGGADAATNLVTACWECNNERGDKHLNHFCSLMGWNPRRIRALAERPLPREEAEELIVRYGRISRVARAVSCQEPPPVVLVETSLPPPDSAETRGPSA